MAQIETPVTIAIHSMAFGLCSPLRSSGTNRASVDFISSDISPDPEKVSPDWFGRWLCPVLRSLDYDGTMWCIMPRVNTC
jgi:hypothetical protein